MLCVAASGNQICNGRGETESERRLGLKQESSEIAPKIYGSRVWAGAQRDELLWGQADHSRIVQILHNPRYAGAFVYGRTRTRRKPDGKSVSLKVSREEWQFLIRDVHPGYISWDRFEANQKRLAENMLAFGTVRKLGPAREGPALLQGRVLCGLCGERMGVHYWREKGKMGITYVCQEGSVRQGTKCASVCRARWWIER